MQSKTTQAVTCSAARHELLEARDLEHHPDIPAYALSELKLKYLTPLRSTQTYILTVSVKAFKKARAILSQRVILLHEHDEGKDQVWFVPGQVHCYSVHACEHCTSTLEFYLAHAGNIDGKRASSPCLANVNARFILCCKATAAHVMRRR